MAEPLDPQLEALVTRPREDLHIEIKNWVDLSDPAGKATLAKAIIALANHGGGFVVIGLAERDDGTFAPADSCPPNLNPYSQDAVNGIVQAYAAPVFHCAVHHVAHPATGDPTHTLERVSRPRRDRWQPGPTADLLGLFDRHPRSG
jgi:hypothetical protein